MRAAKSAEFMKITVFQRFSLSLSLSFERVSIVSRRCRWKLPKITRMWAEYSSAYIPYSYTKKYYIFINNFHMKKNIYYKKNNNNFKPLTRSKDESLECGSWNKKTHTHTASSLATDKWVPRSHLKCATDCACPSMGKQMPHVRRLRLYIQRSWRVAVKGPCVYRCLHTHTYIVNLCICTAPSVCLCVCVCVGQHKMGKRVCAAK